MGNGRYAARMKTFTKELWMTVPQRRAIVSLHQEVERLVAESGVRDRLALVNGKRTALLTGAHLSLARTA
jgi:thiamine phosphate synthase YjbQ (UPF0047 family)